MLYEERMNTLSIDRDLRAEEAASAQERFNLALEQVATMQARLLASEDRRRELETGIDVIQNTLRRTIKAAPGFGIRCLTVFGFSTENWSRPEDEVSDLMGLVRSYVASDLARLTKAGVRLKILGRREGLPADIAAIIERAETQTAHNDRFLLQVAFNYGGRADIVDAAQRFADRVIAEMRGVSDEQGNSPVWQWLEEHFFSVDFPTADYLTGIGQKVFIAELMPRHPIYVGLLPEAAQNVIGQVHQNTKPALKMLEQEGFAHRGYIDLFDAGPTVEARLSQIKSVAASKKVPVKIAEVQGEQTLAVANTELQQFRASFGKAAKFDADQGVLLLSAEFADTLRLHDGDLARFIILDKA